jgi:hypothetical protein
MPDLLWSKFSAGCALCFAVSFQFFSRLFSPFSSLLFKHQSFRSKIVSIQLPVSVLLFKRSSSTTLTSTSSTINISRQWKDLTNAEKRHKIFSSWRFFAILALLYTFLCGLSVLAQSFQLLAAHSSGNLFGFINNPMTGIS